MADTDEQARQELLPEYKRMHDRIGAERGWSPTGRAQFDQEAQHGSLYVGAPETVARKIAATARKLGLSRFDMKYSAGVLAHDKLLHSITLYGRKVIPLVGDARLSSCNGLSLEAHRSREPMVIASSDGAVMRHVDPPLLTAVSRPSECRTILRGDLMHTACRTTGTPLIGKRRKRREQQGSGRKIGTSR
ncbi:MAG: hypothetical protein J2P47_10655 [Acetobacteraceae bacterium]|nr:hypothetical protein [Acetobacteraceae bacterium]